MSATLTDKRIRVVMLETWNANSQARRLSVFQKLLALGYQVTQAGRGTVSQTDGSPLVLLGEFEGDVPEIESKDKTVIHVENVINHSVDTIVDRVVHLAKGMGQGETGKWLPWFPVIDYDRCTNCMQCLSFCLFGVYGVDREKKIQVQNQDKCKTNCPACSRVCPEAAIMFPKYRSGPVNGDAVSEEAMSREKMKIDITALLGGDIYATLRARTEQAKERFSRERDESVALKERQRCLQQLQQEMDIPMEVLMSLPSPEEIKRRAAEAQQAGETARRESMERRREGLD